MTFDYPFAIRRAFFRKAISQKNATPARSGQIFAGLPLTCYRLWKSYLKASKIGHLILSQWISP